ncbi:MAG: single-stranded-DNA-specific exonuclease RecJ [Pseudomonadota bacterium]
MPAAPGSQLAPAFLGVAASVTGRRWVGPQDNDLRAAAALVQQAALSPPVALVLARAGVHADGVDDYLNPTLRNQMPDPSHLLDMDRATEVVLDHLDKGSRIAVFGDYDVDGAASAALLHEWFVALDVRPTLYIPDRIDEGYGPNDAAMQSLADRHELIICVDCGTLSHQPIATAKARGADVIVLDHHLGAETLPAATAVVNPNRQDERSEFSYLCAAGVVFLLLVSLNRARRTKGASEPSLIPMLDLVALATVADVAPLVGLNRALVKQGLAVMARRARPGLVALSDTAGLRSAPAAYHLGFLLGPRINAGGRVGQADLGTRLLTCNDPAEAAALAEKLDQLNTQRRAIEAEVQTEALAQAEARSVEAPLVWAAGERWHPGVVGIVAARLKEAFNRPAVVIGLDGDEGKGSGRSISGVDLGAAVATCASEGHLVKGGGHRMAAGLTVRRGQIDTAMARLSDLLDRQGAGRSQSADLKIDGVLSAAAATPDLIEMLERAGPFGAAAPQPRFAFSRMRVRFAKRVGENHLSATFDDGADRLSAIAFRAADGPLAPILNSTSGQLLHIAGKLEVDDWRGQRKAKLRVEDIAVVDN